MKELTIQDQIMISDLVADGVSFEEIAQRYEIFQSDVKDILKLNAANSD